MCHVSLISPTTASFRLPPIQIKSYTICLQFTRTLHEKARYLFKFSNRPAKSSHYNISTPQKVSIRNSNLRLSTKNFVSSIYKYRIVTYIKWWFANYYWIVRLQLLVQRSLDLKWLPKFKRQKSAFIIPSLLFLSLIHSNAWSLVFFQFHYHQESYYTSKLTISKVTRN